MSTETASADATCPRLTAWAECFANRARTAISVLTNSKANVTGHQVARMCKDTWPDVLQSSRVVQCTTTVESSSVVQWFLEADAAAIAMLAEHVGSQQPDSAELDEATLLDQMREIAAALVEALVQALAEQIGVTVMAGETVAQPTCASAASLQSIRQAGGATAVVLQLEINGRDASQSWLIVPPALVARLSSVDGTQERTVSSAGEGAPDPAACPGDVERIRHIRVPVTVTLARRKMRVSDVLRLGTGAILEFDKPYGEPLELCVGGQPVGTGEAIRIGERFGLKVLEIGPVRERIRRLGA